MLDQRTKERVIDEETSKFMNMPSVKLSTVEIPVADLDVYNGWPWDSNLRGLIKVINYSLTTKRLSAFKSCWFRQTNQRVWDLRTHRMVSSTA